MGPRRGRIAASRGLSSLGMLGGRPALISEAPRVRQNVHAHDPYLRRPAVR